MANVVPIQTSSKEEEGKESPSIYNRLEDEDYWPVELMELGLGELTIFSRKDMDEIPVNDYGASLIQGLLFHDLELSWCRITGWGFECGIPIVFLFTPEGRWTGLRGGTICVVDGAETVDEYVICSCSHSRV